MIPIFYPYVPEEAIEEVVGTLRSQWIGQAHKVDLFEKKFGELFNVKYPVSLNSGTAALETAYELIGLGQGDEVISTPLTCTATNIGLLRRGVKIIWADIREDTLNIDAEDVRRKMSDKTKAIVQVHLGGVGSDIGSFRVPVVSDACQALGIFTGDYTCNSFQAIKHITTGDGGMLTVNTEHEYKKAKLMRWFGIDREKKEKNNWQAYKERKMTFDIEIPGYKWQMTDIAAGMGLAGLRHYNYIIDYRKRLFDLYKLLLKNVDGIRIVDGEVNTYWMCSAIVERRDDFAKLLWEKNIDTNMVHIRNDVYRIFGGKRADLPVMNDLESKYTCLPLHLNIQEGDVHYICDTIKKGW